MRAVPVLAFDGNEAAGAMGACLEPWQLGDSKRPGQPGSVIKNFRAWHAGGVFVYTAHDLTFDGLVMRGDVGLLNANKGPGTAVFANDYRTPGLLITGGDVQGYNAGWSVAPEGDARMAHTHLACYAGVVVETIWQGGLDAALQRPRRTVLENVTFRAPIGRDLPETHPRCEVYMRHRPRGSDNTNLVALNEVLSYRHGGVAGDDLRLYYREQRPERVLEQTVMEGGKTVLLGCPEAGLTNAQALAKHGVCYAGAVAPPAAAERAGIIGLAVPLPSP